MKIILNTFFIFVLSLQIIPQSVNWTELNSPFSSKVRVLYMSTQNVLFAGGDLGFLKTSDDGQNWDTVFTKKSMSLYTYNDSIWYLSTMGDSGIFLTTNYGETWSQFGQPIPNPQVYDIAINRNDNTVFATTSNGLYKSTDNGLNWLYITNGYPGADFPDIAVESIGDTIVVLGKDDNNYGLDIYHSTDNGNSWSVLVLEPLGSGQIMKIPEDILYLAWRYYDNSGFNISTDGGESWDVIFHASFIPQEDFGPMINGLNNSVILWAETHYHWGAFGGLLISYDNFTTYGAGPLWDPSYNLSITSLAYNSNEDVFAGLEGGQIRKITGLFNTVGVEYRTRPIQFNLSQNFPNPFNPTTTIKFTIPELSFVTLKVYDVLGNEIATLVNEEKPAGTYEIEFSVTHESFLAITSGVYFYQLKVYPANGGAEGYVENKKMILLR